MSAPAPSWLDPDPWMQTNPPTNGHSVSDACFTVSPGIRELVTLLSPAADNCLEIMARRAQAITRRHFGKTISLYAPLYLSNHCPGGCVYCGFAADRKQTRRRLEEDEFLMEMDALKSMGFEDILLLTGERTAEADFDYLLRCVSMATRKFHNVTVESFAMTEKEYGKLDEAGCAGITLYQETYDPRLYRDLHRWGPKQDYLFRIEAPARALSAGLRTVGLGVLLGLGEPIRDMVCLVQHIEYLRSRLWQGGLLVSFPRICSQQGGYRPGHPVSDRLLAQMIFALRICLPDVPLVLSTRERPLFRDSMAGLGISKMSAASRTTVGGYHSPKPGMEAQFEVNDTRDAQTVCNVLKAKGLEPVFKNWDSVFQL